MIQQPGPQRFATAALAVVLWLLTFGLGLESMYDLLLLIYLGYGALTGNVQAAEAFAIWIVVVLGLAFLAFIIASTEYHRKHFGKPESWRLFGISLAVEVSIIVLYYIL